MNPEEQKRLVEAAAMSETAGSDGEPQAVGEDQDL